MSSMANQTTAFMGEMSEFAFQIPSNYLISYRFKKTVRSPKVQ